VAKTKQKIIGLVAQKGDMMTRMIKIFDTTLRDGEQSPGASMNVEEKVMVAKQLARLGVDIIEAGFAYSSPGDFQAVRRIAQEVEGPTICSLARARPEDIDRAWEALKGAPKVRIHTFLSTSDIHWKHQFRMTREEAKKRAVEMVQRARGYVEDVEFSPMDASRSDPDYLYEVIEAVISAGAGTVNIPDTVRFRRSSASSSGASENGCRIAARRSSPCTVTTTSDWRWPIASPPS
jgi:2-isopropylmalate synthase